MTLRGFSASFPCCRPPPLLWAGVVRRDCLRSTPPAGEGGVGGSVWGVFAPRYPRLLLPVLASFLTPHLLVFPRTRVRPSMAPASLPPLYCAIQHHHCHRGTSVRQLLRQCVLIRPVWPALCVERRSACPSWRGSAGCVRADLPCYSRRLFKLLLCLQYCYYLTTYACYVLIFHVKFLYTQLSSKMHFDFLLPPAPNARVNIFVEVCAPTQQFPSP